MVGKKHITPLVTCSARARPQLSPPARSAAPPPAHASAWRAGRRAASKSSSSLGASAPRLARHWRGIRDLPAMHAGCWHSGTGPACLPASACQLMRRAHPPTSAALHWWWGCIPHRHCPQPPPGAWAGAETPGKSRHQARGCKKPGQQGRKRSVRQCLAGLGDASGRWAR